MKLLSLLLVLGLPLATEAVGGQDRPNIVFILADDLGWNALSANGGQWVETPNLDRLAAEGMRFTNAYALSQCLPTRAALFSGQWGARTGLTSVETASPDYAPMISPGRPEGLPPETYTVFEMLRDAGYATGMSGKWHLDRNYDANGLMRKQGIGHFRPFGLDFVGTSDTSEKNVTGVTDDMLQFIRAHRNGPFVAYLAHHSVHTPMAAPEEVIEKHLARGFRRSSTRTANSPNG